MNMLDSTANRYPIMRFLVSNGTTISFLLSGLLLVVFIVAGVATGLFWLWGVGVVVSVAVLGLLLSYVEVLKIISDTLLPKY